MEKAEELKNNKDWKYCNCDFECEKIDNALVRCQNKDKIKLKTKPDNEIDDPRTEYEKYQDYCAERRYPVYSNNAFTNIARFINGKT